MPSRRRASGDHLRQRFRLRSSECRLVRIGNDHDVSRGVGIAVQDHKGFLAAEDDEGFSIVMRFGRVAENAAVILRAGGDVAVPPGRPKIIHGDEDLL